MRKKLDAVRELLALVDAQPTVETLSEYITKTVREHTASCGAVICVRDDDLHDLREKPGPAPTSQDVARRNTVGGLLRWRFACSERKERGRSRSNRAGRQAQEQPRDPLAAAFEYARIVTCTTEDLEPALRAVVPEAESFTLVPMVGSRGCVGVVILGAAQPLPEEDIDFVSTLARIAARGLPASQQRFDALQKLKRGVDAISRLGVNAEFDAVRDGVVEAASEALETDLVALFTIDPVSGALECRSTDAVTGSLQDAFWERFGHLAVNPDEKAACLVYDTDRKRRDREQAAGALVRFGIRAVLAAPLRSESGSGGVLAVFYTSPLTCAHARHAILELLAAQASAAISYALAIEQSRCLLDDLAGANRELSVQATCDGLTGLPNHRSLQQKLREMCARPASAGERRVFSVAMLDVDHFKFYNDAHGHQEGDAALQAVAKLIASGLRRNDFAARYGGEEFAIVLSDVGKAGAVAVAERIRQTVAEHVFAKGRLTVSLGVSEYPSDGSTPGEIIERADRALYHAKITGRNRVVAWGAAGTVGAESDDESRDDNRPNRMVLLVELQNRATPLRDMLPADSYTVEVARGTEAAAELLKTRRYDIVLVSGKGRSEDHKCLSTIAAIHPNMPVVLITSDLSVEASRDALRSGASDVFLRPTSPGELPLVIERNLERMRVEKQRLAERSTGVMLQAIDALVAAIDAKDPFTAGHSNRVTSLALAISDHFHISGEERWALELAARLHDIGKLGLPDSALNKQSALTDEEWEAMRDHPALGSRIVGAIDELAYVSNIIRHHHERLDGTGYPDGLRGEAIPFLAQVIAVADAYEAMTAERAHRSPLSPQEAIDELRLHAGTYYNPEIVEVMAELVSESPQSFEAATRDRAA
jgi:putative two-component system response regulator